MPKGYAKKREQAFQLRLQRKTFKEVAHEVGVASKTVSRWEKGWIDAKGTKHPGWKPEMEKAWRELAETELKCGLMLKEERIKAYEELAQLAIAKVKEMFPSIKAKTAADAKALLSEIRELGRLIAQEKGEFHPSPQTIVAVKTDITLTELQDRYKAAYETQARVVRPGPGASNSPSDSA